MIRKIFGKFKSLITNFYWNNISYETFNIKYNWNDNIFCHIQDEMWEDVNLAEVYNITQGITFKALYPELNIYKFTNACIFAYSDMVIENNLVMWDKAYFPTFSKTIPRDKNLLSYNEEAVKIKKYDEVIIKGKCFSLVGTYSYIWSHFVLQYVSKLFIADKMGVIDKNTTILVPTYEDKHLQRIVESYVNQLDVKIMYLNKDKKYRCDELYFIPTMCSTPNVCKYLLPQDYVMPAVTKSAIKEYLISPYLSYRDENKNYKLYLIRREGARALINWKEIENFFEAEGFTLLEPHKIPFEEKIDLFSNASVVVGPFSSAFTNIIWCRPKTKILMLSNHPRTVESSFCELGDIAEASMMYVTGEDKEKNNAHTDFYISLDKVKQAYKDLCNR